jgi:hypothetical protein
VGRTTVAGTRHRIRPRKASELARRTGPEAVLITDAAPSLSTEQRRRRRRYTILMALHLIGFALSGFLYYHAWWLGLVLLIITTPLPWVAVVLANSPSRTSRRAFRPPHQDRGEACPVDAAGRLPPADDRRAVVVADLRVHGASGRPTNRGACGEVPQADRM